MNVSLFIYKKQRFGDEKVTLFERVKLNFRAIIMPEVGVFTLSFLTICGPCRPA
jgi:hypothetical protein